MTQDDIYRRYFASNTVGYLTVLKFFREHNSLLSVSRFPHFEDVLHEVFLAVSGIDFETVRNPDHYIHRTIKIQCWAILDKIKKDAHRHISLRDSSTDILPQASENLVGNLPLTPLDHVTYSELLTIMIRFKSSLKDTDTPIFEMMHEDSEQFYTQFAQQSGININTLRTKIFRMRRRFQEHLKKWGYEYQKT